MDLWHIGPAFDRENVLAPEMVPVMCFTYRPTRFTFSECPSTVAVAFSPHGVWANERADQDLASLRSKVGTHDGPAVAEPARRSLSSFAQDQPTAPLRIGPNGT